MLANSGQMWFYHAPSKRLDASKQLVPAASQIPGLAALDPLDQEAWEREVGVKNKAKESDSHYIRLAKQGGRKNLLNFSQMQETIDDSRPKSYPRVDWFDHHDSDPEKDKQILSQSIWQPPEYMIHEYEPMEEDSVKSDGDKAVWKRPKRAPFYTDNMSVWARKEEEMLTRKKSKRKGQAHNHSKLPELTSRSPPVKFSKLIGGEYGNEWYQDQARHAGKGRGMKKQNPNEAKSDKGYLNLTEYQQSICRKVIPPKKLKPIVLAQSKRPTDKRTEKDMFKLSKFNNVSSKLKTGAD